jgi:hypothetical protein
MLFFRVMTPCGLVGIYQHFGETYCLQPWRWRQCVSLKRWCLPTSLHSIITQRRTTLSSFIIVRTSNLMSTCWCVYVCVCVCSASFNIEKGSHTYWTHLNNITVGDRHPVATWVNLKNERANSKKKIAPEAHESWTMTIENCMWFEAEWWFVR